MSTIFSLKWGFISFGLWLLLSLSMFQICFQTIPNSNIPLSSSPSSSDAAWFSIKGESPATVAGYPVSIAGDINGDGYDDIIAGVYKQNNYQGAAYVIYGGPSPTAFSEIDLELLDPGSTGFKITGEAVGDYFGSYTSTAGDINGDGLDDIMIAAFHKYNYAGAVYVIYGRPTELLSHIDLSTTPLDPLTSGFAIKGEANSYLGFSIGPAGDINQDGKDDMIIGASEANSLRGAAYVVYGGVSLSNLDLSSTSLSLVLKGFKIIGEASGDYFGLKVNPAGDINQDGYSDIIIATYQKNSAQGVVYVIYGKSGLTDMDLSITPLDPLVTGFMIMGEAAGDRFGSSINAAGDVNKDGYNDLLIGAYSKENSRGASYVIYGRQPSLLSHLDLSTTPLNPLRGFRIMGEAAGDTVGLSLGAAGDINNDGFHDIFVTAPFKNANQGTIYVIYGGTGLSNIDLGLVSFDFAQTGFTITGPADNCLGYLISSGDINGDGYVDIVAGASGPNSVQGSIYVIYQVCLALNCDVCNPRHTCQVCTKGYGLTTNLQCEVCPPDCLECQFSASCDVCKNTHFLYKSLCVTSCPSRAIPILSASGNKCEDCLPHCLSCSSSKSCQRCDQGYELSDSQCILSTSISDGAASQKIKSALSSAGSILNTGSSLFATTALVSKIVQNMRYIDTVVTDDLKEIYKNWGTELFSWEFPISPSSTPFKPLEYLFSQYNLDSSFLANFWSNLMTIGGALGIWILCKLLKEFLEHIKIQQGLLIIILQKLISGFMNFAVVKVYGELDDILFYLILDLKTNLFNSTFSWISLCSAVAFTFLGGFLIFVNIYIVRRYQRVKKDKREFEAFNEKYKYLELLYSDFNDKNSWIQSFFAFLILRNCISSIIITTLSSLPILQMLNLLVLDLIIIIFLYTKNPFIALQAKLAQYYFEAITILVHICVLALTIRDQQEHRSKDQFRMNICTLIIYLNIILVSGTLGFLFIEIYKAIDEYIERRKSRLEKNQESLKSLSTVHPINLTTNTERDLSQASRRGLESENFQNIMSLRAGSTRNPHNFYLRPPRQNYSSSRALDISSNIDNSWNQEVNTSQLVMNQHYESSRPIITQRRIVRNKRDMRNKNNSIFQNSSQ